MGIKKDKKHVNQQERSGARKNESHESFNGDELRVENYEREKFPNSPRLETSKENWDAQNGQTARQEPQHQLPSDAKAGGEHTPIPQNPAPSTSPQKNDANSAVKGRGPRGARGKMREQIKKVAESQFIARGYDGTTMRSIAKGAGCDPAMVSYYFGSKQRLFRDCFDLPLDPLEQILQLWAPGIEGVADRLLDFAFTLYEERLTKDRMKALMRALITDAETTQRFRAYIRDNLLKGVAQLLDAVDPNLDSDTRQLLEARFQTLVEILMSMIYGVATMRYIVQLEPVASMPREELQRFLSPILQTQIENLAREMFPFAILKK